MGGLHGSEDAGGSQTEGQLFYGDVTHPPWNVYEADVALRSTNFFGVNGFGCPDEDPLAHYSPGVPVTADRVQKLDRVRR